ALKLQSVTPDIQSSAYELFSSLGPERDLPTATLQDDWHLDTINYTNNVPAGLTGQGVRIGHPDTGWTAHPEMGFNASGQSPNFDLNSDVNIYDPNAAGARENVPAVSNPPFYHAHHGTYTASVIVSESNNGRVFGIAPGARIVSIRAIDSVILIADINVAQAIVAAVEAGVQVISMSLGGYPADILRWAVNWAVAQDVIVIAAAGNKWPFVVYPAAYSSCIAVGGCTIDDTVWGGSARDYDMNDTIDISAPAEGLRVAFWNNETPNSSRGSGTSFATAIVAGSAALWLQFYGRNNLINSLSGRMPLQELFRAHIRNTARTPAGWNIFLDGPGILNIEGLLNRNSLPDPNTFPFPPEIYEVGNVFGVDLSAAPGSRVSLPGWVETLFGDNTAELVDNFGEELVTMVMSDPLLAMTARRLSRSLERAEELANAAAQAAEDLANLASDAADEVVEAAEDALETAEELVEEAADAVEEQAEEFIDNAADTASDAFNTVTGWFS
ncbi:MAG: S8/S53 family peptidase, partial [Lentisphaeraceae bacterium]|nr:S8/S53 family peptidase [Lentisphaeraceae bacterium]